MEDEIPSFSEESDEDQNQVQIGLLPSTFTSSQPRKLPSPITFTSSKKSTSKQPRKYKRKPNRTGYPNKKKKKIQNKNINTIRSTHNVKPSKIRPKNSGLQGQYWDSKKLGEKRQSRKPDNKPTIPPKNKAGGLAVLPIGTQVSAKYKGAFCVATVKNVEKQIEITTNIVTNDGSIGQLKNISDRHIISGKIAKNAIIEVKDPVSDVTFKAMIRHINDKTKYHCVFDDGDVAILKRSSLVVTTPGDSCNYVTPSEISNTISTEIEMLSGRVITSSKFGGSFDTTPSTSSATPSTSSAILKQVVPIPPPLQEAPIIRVDDALQMTTNETKSEKATVVIHNDIKDEEISIDSEPIVLVPQVPDQPIPTIPQVDQPTTIWEGDDSDIVLLSGVGLTSSMKKEESLATLQKSLNSDCSSFLTTKVKISFDSNPKKYLIKIRKKTSESSPITLHDLKRNMPVSGNFRYFVKNIDQEDGEWLFEEFLNDNDILPLYHDNQIHVECKSIL